MVPPSFLGPLERASLNHWPTFILPEDRNRSSFRNVVLLRKHLTIDKVQKHDYFKYKMPYFEVTVTVFNYTKIACTITDTAHRNKPIKSCVTTRYEGAWGETKYSSYSFSTSALDGGEWSASRPGRALSPRKGPPIPIVQEAGWASESVWTQRLEEKSFHPCRGSNFDRLVVQPVARYYTELPGS
jgi:hypothetical protein